MVQRKYTAVVALVAGLCAAPVIAQGVVREAIRERAKQALEQRHVSMPPVTPQGGDLQKCKIAGLDVAVWEPADKAHRLPLVIFSHGFHGRNTQSGGLASAMADAGYLVMAPNHIDAIGSSMKPPHKPFKSPQLWSESTHRDRGLDIRKLLEALHNDSRWGKRVDWSRVALCGHSLGGYTCLGLAGAWPSWKLPDIKAVLALSPYVSPYLITGSLSTLAIPVMYQGGTRDVFITPNLRKPRGAFDQSSSPTYFVDLLGANHFAWTNRNDDSRQQELIVYYSLAFLDRYVKGDRRADPGTKLSGVYELRSK